MSVNLHDSDAILEETNRLTEKRLENERRARDQKHEAYMSTTGRVFRTLAIVGSLTAICIFGGPYILQGCNTFNTQWTIRAEQHAVESRQAAKEMEAALAAQRAERDAPRLRRQASVETCIKTLGAAVCTDVADAALLEAWDSDARYESIGHNVGKILRDRGVVSK